MFFIERIATYAKTKEIIEKHNFYFKKNFGQNFLIDQHVLSKIINTPDISKDDFVIEIGPGIGSLTQMLAEKAGKVLAIEIDNNLIPILKDTLKEYENVEIINDDILKIDLNKIINNSCFKNIKIVANLPYYITTPIIMHILESKCKIDSITVMVQKEVAERMQASPGEKNYGAITLAILYYSEPYLVANVPKNCFIPRPNVNSAVIHFKIRKDPLVNVSDEKLMFKIIKYGFGQRRKTLLNCIFNMPEFNFDKEEIEKILISCGFDPKIRAEKLSLEDFAYLTNYIKATK